MSLWKSKETILQNSIGDTPSCASGPVICHMLMITVHWCGKLAHPDLPGLIRTQSLQLKGQRSPPKAQGEASP